MSYCALFENIESYILPSEEDVWGKLIEVYGEIFEESMTKNRLIELGVTVIKQPEKQP